MRQSKQNSLRLAAAVALLGAMLVQCGGKSPTKPAASPYLAPTSPENVIKNFTTMFDSLDAAEADSIFTDEFVFRFQPGDVVPGQPDSLIRGGMQSFLEHLLVTGKAGSNSAPPASSVQLVVTVRTVSNDLRPGHEGWKKYAVTTSCAIGFPDGNELTINSPANFYFRQVPDGSGRWRIAEWQDLSASGATLPVRARSAGAGADISFTWGRLIEIFR